MVSTPPFAESVTEGDVKWEKGERERTTSSWVAFCAYFEGGKRFFLGGGGGGGGGNLWTCIIELYCV